MTNEEAIEIIRNYNVNSCGYCHQGGNETEEAFEKAIKALEQEPCEDCISREAVIRLAEQYPLIIGSRCSGLIADIKHLPSVTPKARWIPVSERLPEDYIHVLCQFTLGGMGECYLAHGVFHVVGGLVMTCNEVIAWMPLPKPYKEGENEGVN